MQKTFASLLVTLAVSVMGIPVAYLVGQRSAEHDIQQRLIEERARARAEQQALISDLRAGLAPPPAAANAPLADSAPPASAPAPKSPQPTEETPAPVAEATSATPPLPAIPRESFDAVALGVTYPEAAQKLGREGLPALTMEDGLGSLTRQYVWQWIGPQGKPGRATLRFVDGSLTEKNFSE